MKKIKILVLLVIVIFILSGINLFKEKNMRVKENESTMYSPTGNYTLEKYNLKDRNEVDGFSFKIYNKRGEVEFNSKDSFRKRDRFLLYWGDSEDITWVYSGDVGLFYWKYSEEKNEWVKFNYTANGENIPKIPEEMHKMLPKNY